MIYFSMGFLSLFWIWFLDGPPKGQKRWHLWANVVSIVGLWPIYVLITILNQASKPRV